LFFYFILIFKKDAKGFEKNYEKALQLFEKSIELGVIDAHYKFGWMHERKFQLFVF
jgi:TPR repeat protein